MTHSSRSDAQKRFAHLIATRAIDSDVAIAVGIVTVQSLNTKANATALLSQEALQQRLISPEPWLSGVTEVFMSAADWLNHSSRKALPLSNFLTASCIPPTNHPCPPTVPSMMAGEYADLFLLRPAQTTAALAKTLRATADENLHSLPK